MFTFSVTICPYNQRIHLLSFIVDIAFDVLLVWRNFGLHRGIEEVDWITGVPFTMSFEEIIDCEMSNNAGYCVDASCLWIVKIVVLDVIGPCASLEHAWAGVSV